MWVIYRDIPGKGKGYSWDGFTAKCINLEIVLTLQHCANT
jgi:hypothetical protein